jgi:hypothetical protein
MWQFIKDLFLILGELATFGGLVRLEDARESYNANYEEYRKIHAKIELISNENSRLLSEIGEKTESAFRALKKAEGALRQDYRVRERGAPNFGNEDAKSAVERIDKLSDRYSSAATATLGTATGGAVAAGSWALVSIAGTASTGAAISTISGVAASNATLAWFGGGALAAGGAGMAGGMVVLSGLLLLPIVLIWGVSIHKKAKKLEAGAKEIAELLPSLPRELERMELYNKTIKANHLLICDACESLVEAIRYVVRQVHRWGWFSVAFRSIRSRLWGAYYTEEELDLLDKLTEQITAFLDLFDRGVQGVSK